MIFVSHASADATETGILEGQLRAWGAEPWLAERPDVGISGGEDWVRRLYTELRRCDAVVALWSQAAHASHWCAFEVAVAYAEGHPIYLVTLGDTPRPDYLGSVQATRWEERGRLEGAIRELARVSPALSRTRSPFPGLDPYTEEDAGAWFGRDAEVVDARAVLRRLVRVGRPPSLLVAGASGCGKSSFVRAGLVPALRRDGGRWAVLPVSPPADTNATALRRALEEAAALPPAADGATRVLVLDQLEMLSAAPPADQQAARAALATLMADPRRPTALVGTVATPFLDAVRTLWAPVLPETWLLGPMSAQARRAAIETPCARAGVTLEPGLADHLVAESASPDALPLLAHLLGRLWEQQERQPKPRRFTRADVDALGGLAGLLAADAATAVAGLDDRARASVRRCLLRLVDLDDAGRWVRVTAPWDGVEPDAHPAFTLLCQLRLLSRDGPGVRFSHDAVTHAWPELAGWLAAEAPVRRMLLALRRATDEWEASGRSDDLLWTLPRIRGLDALEDPHRRPADQAFLDAGVSLAARRSAEVRAALVAEAQHLSARLSALDAEEEAAEFAPELDRHGRAAAYLRIAAARSACNDRLATLNRIL